MRCKLSKRIISFVFAAIFVFSCFGCAHSGVTPDILPHLTVIDEQSVTRAIDSYPNASMSEFSGNLTDEQYRARVDELYSIVVYDRKKPIFAQSDPTEHIYTAARAVLDKYVPSAWQNDDDGQYKTVHAIHDYLCAYVDYDFALYELFTEGERELANNAAFYMDGALVNGRAVCDGLARAFDFLCAISGIDSFRVTGSYGAGPHAWNKVKLGDVWYNADVTADCAYYTDADGKYKRQISHGYFLVSDKTIAEFKPNGHDFVTPPFDAAVDYDYYATERPRIVIGGKEYSSVISSYAELENLFKAIYDGGDVGKFEVKLDFPGKTMVNSVDMYASEIAAAYSNVKNSNYDFSSGLPYFRYPNGVYLFLVYK